MITRRQFIKLGLLGTATLTIPAAIVGAQSQNEQSPRSPGMSRRRAGAAQQATSPEVAAFQRSLPLPLVLAPGRTDATTDYYEITMREAEMEILPGRATTIWGYEGLYPGPTIKAREGRRAVVRQINRLPDGMTIHLHGGHVPGEMDGHPMGLIPTGGHKDYIYPNTQPAATLWYHDHAMDLTGPHVYAGLAGLYLIEDGLEASLPLPEDEYDIPLLIQDRLFNPDGSLSYTLTEHSGMMGPMMGGRGGMMGGMMSDRVFLGDTILVNGAVQPYLQVAARKYRLRILNGSNAREYDLALSSGRPFAQIGTDNGLMPAPVTRRSIYLASAERADVVVDFSEYEVGDQVVLENRLGSGSTAAVMRFDVVKREADGSSIPDRLRPLEELRPAEAVRTRSFVLSQGRGDSWLINGRVYDPDRIDATARTGEVEVWEFFNRSMMPHPMHIHQTSWQVLSRNGAPPPSWERGWKDTFNVGPMERVQVIGRYSDYTGVYSFHCHILEHEDRGMMGQFLVEH
jgi:spore coat protein A, manganese oxidase